MDTIKSLFKRRRPKDHHRPSTPHRPKVAERAVASPLKGGLLDEEPFPMSPVRSGRHVCVNCKKQTCTTPVSADMSTPITSVPIQRDLRARRDSTYSPASSFATSYSESGGEVSLDDEVVATDIPAAWPIGLDLESETAGGGCACGDFECRSASCRLRPLAASPKTLQFFPPLNVVTTNKPLDPANGLNRDPTC